jgi:hypothetical protein
MPRLMTPTDAVVFMVIGLVLVLASRWLGTEIGSKLDRDSLPNPSLEHREREIQNQIWGTRLVGFTGIAYGLWRLFVGW